MSTKCDHTQCIGYQQCQFLTPVEQCSCERLGITPGVQGGKRCPGCPKAQTVAPFTPEELKRTPMGKPHPDPQPLPFPYDHMAEVKKLINNALTYLSDEEDVESTPQHAIGHAKTELRQALELLL